MHRWDIAFFRGFQMAISENGAPPNVMVYDHAFPIPTISGHQQFETDPNSYCLLYIYSNVIYISQKYPNKHQHHNIQRYWISIILGDRNTNIVGITYIHIPFLSPYERPQPRLAVARWIHLGESAGAAGRPWWRSSPINNQLVINDG